MPHDSHSDAAPTGESADHPHFPQPMEIPVSERDSGLDLKTQLFRFIATGVLSAIVDFGLLTVLTQAAGFEHAPAKAISFICGTTTAYLINRRWTFKAEPSRARFIAVVLLYALTFALQVGLYMALYHALHGVLAGRGASIGMDELVASTVGFVIAQGVATICNFIVQRTVIFKLR